MLIKSYPGYPSGDNSGFEGKNRYIRINQMEIRTLEGSNYRQMMELFKL